MVDVSSKFSQVHDLSSTRDGSQIPTENTMTTLTTAPALAELTGSWTIDPAHSRIGFVARHAMVTKVRGAFNEFEGSAVLDASNPASSTARITIQAKSIDTRNGQRDEHLRSNDFFGTGDHPQLVFRSTRVEHIPGPTFRVHGDLTMKGITRPVVLDATFNGSGVNPWGQTVASWSATTEIDREEWEMGFNAALETGGVLVGTRIKLSLEIEAAQQS